MKDFCPIALYNVSYKIISKILVNRLKHHLPNIVSENQMSLISYNIMVAHEIFHSLKSRKRQATSYMAVKTDITKAYDRLEWRFLKEPMQFMGFGEKWIQIYGLIFSVNKWCSGRFYYTRTGIKAGRSVILLSFYSLRRSIVSHVR